jgi:hypothetical protein
METGASTLLSAGAVGAVIEANPGVLAACAVVVTGDASTMLDAGVTGAPFASTETSGAFALLCSNAAREVLARVATFGFVSLATVSGASARKGRGADSSTEPEMVGAVEAASELRIKGTARLSAGVG